MCADRVSMPESSKSSRSLDPSPSREFDRRGFLARSSLGTIALLSLLQRELRSESSKLDHGARGSSTLPHAKPRAKQVLQIFAAGGVSHIDTFQYKPELTRLAGKTLEGKGENKGFFGQPGRIQPSPFAFARKGACGQWVSEIFPCLGECVDRLTFIHSMVARSNNHTPATFQMNSGYTLNGFPSMGAWTSYGLGSLEDDLPTFVVLPDPRGLPAGGSINWTAGFLPAEHQGTALRTSGSEAISFLRTPESVTPEARARAARFLARRNRAFADLDPGDSSLLARVRSYELAARMQLRVPEAVDVESESEATRSLYGLDRDESRGFGRNCLLARRLLERGVRFVQLFHGGAFGSPRINWDGHEELASNHRSMAPSLDRPLAGLIVDLEQRGLLDDVLIVWCTEFGRGPATQGIGSTGRDHHPDAFTCFLGGAGVRRGYAHGASDEVGYFVADDPVTTYDLHATILHLLGIDHKRLTFYHNGIERRLTDVHGDVVEGILS
jgi:hypothetical protein